MPLFENDIGIGPTFIDIIEQPHKGVVGADEVGDEPNHAEQQ
jgi:hypothetical protein